jgi:hypothetical protein
MATGTYGDIVAELINADLRIGSTSRTSATEGATALKTTRFPNPASRSS